MVADACAPAYLALAPTAAAVMLAYRRPVTRLALVLAAVMVADACAPAVLAATLLAVLGTLLGGGLCLVLDCGFSLLDDEERFCQNTRSPLMKKSD